MEHVCGDEFVACFRIKNRYTTFNDVLSLLDTLTVIGVDNTFTIRLLTPCKNRSFLLLPSDEDVDVRVETDSVGHPLAGTYNCLSSTKSKSSHALVHLADALAHGDTDTCDALDRVTDPTPTTTEEPVTNTSDGATAFTTFKTLDSKSCLESLIDGGDYLTESLEVSLMTLAPCREKIHQLRRSLRCFRCLRRRCRTRLWYTSSSTVLRSKFGTHLGCSLVSFTEFVGSRCSRTNCCCFSFSQLLLNGRLGSFVLSFELGRTVLTKVREDGIRSDSDFFNGFLVSVVSLSQSFTVKTNSKKSFI